jgi:murein DD-endopeptidase MepM/ murein hydrolase activator NlpD
MLKRISFLLSIQLFSNFIFAQSPYQPNYFGSPTQAPILLVGNFGEIRPNHLHAGFDIKTGGREGLPIYAVADGYIARIKISPKGYGKALYINHPNGYTSVYAHLQGFIGIVGTTAKGIQYGLESFEIDTVLKPGALPVKKGEQIALSGNTGGSQGPHLHFEIRDTKTEAPINPYFFGYTVKDDVKPRITKIAVYPLGKISTVNGKKLPKILTPILNKVGYSFNSSDTITIYGDIGFGIECFDTETGSSNNNSVFSIELQTGGKRIYYSELEKFSFENSRYVNAQIDYAAKQKHNYKIQKCFLVKNNQLGICKDAFNSGVVSFNDDATHWLKFIVKDYFGNTTELVLKVKSSTKGKKAESEDKEVYFDCLKEYTYKTEDVQITIPGYSCYEDVKFTVVKSPKVKGMYSMVYKIQDENTALQKAYILSIKANDVPPLLQNKAVLVSMNSNGKHNYESGTYANGWVSTLTKNFGNFAIAIDNIAPNVKPSFKVSDISNVDFRKAKMIGLTVSDNLSGIKKYRATIDDKWVLCEYEMKKNLLFYEFDKSVKQGKHTFKIEVSDEKNNTTTWTCGFLR